MVINYSNVIHIIVAENEVESTIELLQQHKLIKKWFYIRARNITIILDDDANEKEIKDFIKELELIDNAIM